jgi:hypothetical protein
MIAACQQTEMMMMIGAALPHPVNLSKVVKRVIKRVMTITKLSALLGVQMVLHLQLHTEKQTTKPGVSIIVQSLLGVSSGENLIQKSLILQLKSKIA